MPDTAQSQSQSQSQSQLISINVSNSGDPELEGRILNGVYGVGRQLGVLAAVVEVLLAQREAGPETPSDARAIARFRDMQAAIAAEKRERGPSRIVEQLQAGPAGDEQETRALCRQLRSWLDDYEARLSSATSPTLAPASR